ncbi:MAG: IS91 family transposase, partial [Rhodobacteraceae bacterium]|nr:IS91 family transposase [Paracoccaceae bacterium]
LLHYDGQTVIFNYLNHTTGHHQTRTEPSEAFIARLVQHIPDKGFRMIRYYGFLAHRVRSTLLPKVYALLDQPTPQPPTIRWPALLKHSFGLDPLQCILCQAPLRLSALVKGLSTPELQHYHRPLALMKLLVV